MVLAYQGKIKEVIMGRIDHGEDLLLSLHEIVRKKKVEAGHIVIMGALNYARLGAYDQNKKEYNILELPGQWEITAGTGDISLKDDETHVHIHLVLGDHNGNCLSGHVLEGCKIFACEFVIYSLELDGSLQREYDEKTGLFLWQE